MLLLSLFPSGRAEAFLSICPSFSITTSIAEIPKRLTIETMKHDPFNTALLKEFPLFEKYYQEVGKSTFDLDTPSLNFLDSLFTPYFLLQVEEQNDEEVNHVLLYIENILEDEEKEEEQNLFYQGFFCSLYERGCDLLSLPLGEKEKEYVKDWLMKA